MRGLWLTGLSLICASFLAYGQETTGSISGTVTDPSGAGIPGAKVEISGGSLQKPAETVTDNTGGYRVPSVAPGTGYIVSVSANGFRQSKKAEVAIVLGRASRLDFKLEVGAVTESVVVNADTVILDTSSTSSEVNVDKSFFDLMPKARAFDGLVNLAPGARSESKTGGYQVDGASGSENTFFLGGMEVTNIQNGTLSGGARIPVEMIQQVQVKNGVMDAQYGGAMGGVISASIRSGSNQYHGELGFYFNNDVLSARPRTSLRISPLDDNKAEYFQNPQDAYQTWSPIISFGGPIPGLKDKLYFFSSYSPITTTTDRTVTFTGGSVKPFSSKSTQRYMANKVDYLVSNKLRTSYSWVWSPGFTQGVLPSRGGTDDPNSNWKGFGDYTSNNLISGQIDYIATSKTVVSFRGGYNYTNFTNLYAIPLVTGYYNSVNTVNLNLPGLPSNFRTAAGWVVQPQGATLFNYFPRTNLNADVSHIVNWHGQHSIKGGWQTNRLANGINNNTYPNGYYRFYWNLPYRCTTSQCSGQQVGPYGYYRYRELATLGEASSNNQALFLQDNWRVNKKLTINLGLRTESEFVPAFKSTSGPSSKAIQFDWTQKMSPRVGFAYDLKGDGTNRIYGSFGFFYDIMKYEMPRGSFGGDIWKDYFFSIDDPSVVTKLAGAPATPKTSLPGKFYEVIDYRIPSNDPSNNLVDPNLKPMKQRMFDFGWDHQINSSLLASVRYTNRRLIRTIEDVGVLLNGGENYFIANPGEGLTINPKTWDAGIPVTPKAKRNYDAVEFRLDRRFSAKYQFTASYTWSRLFGNYSGLASSDENGRTSPNVNRYFDLPWLGYTQKGQFSEGRLATDRPHTLKFFGQYTHTSKLGLTTLAPNFVVYSGTPLTTEGSVLGVPMYFYGRGDLGRTPIFSNTDINLVHQFVPFKSKETIKMKLEFSVFNLFNSSTITNRSTNLVNPNDGIIQFDSEPAIFKGFDVNALMKTQELRRDPQYGLASAFQAPRSARVRFSFTF